MSRYALTEAMSGLALALLFANASWGQTFNLPLTRLEPPGGGTTRPTVQWPGAWVSAAWWGYPVQGGATTSDQSVKSDSVEEVLAYDDADADCDLEYHLGHISASAVTQSTVTCLTYVNDTTYSAQVDTDLGVMLTSDGTGNNGLNGCGEQIDPFQTQARWRGGCVVTTVFAVGQNPDHDPVTAATLNGSFWLFCTADASDDRSGLSGGVIIDAVIGGSWLQAQYQGPGLGWSVARNITQSSVANPTAAAVTNTIVYDTYSFEEFLPCTELIAVPSQQALSARIISGDQVGGETELTPGAKTVSLELKSSGEFHVVAP